MNPRLGSVALGLILTATIAAACDDAASTEVTPSDAGAGGADVVAEAASPAPDAGGPLSRPLACPGEGIVHEAFPDQEIFEALRTAAGFEFLERRAVYDSDAAAEVSSHPPLSLGTPCAGAADASACTAALAALSSGGEVLFPYAVDTAALGPKGFYLAYTKGDTVGKIASAGELKAVLAKVDSPVSALMYAEAASYRVMCTMDWYRQEPDGFVVLAEKGPRCRRSRVVLFVRADGAIEERDSVAYDSPCL